jgi:8-oxo-dGTP diphosphatase
MNKSIHVATFAYVVNKKNKVLLLRRAKNDTFPGIWEFPGGGFEAGEDPKESIEREVLEEAGLHIKAVRPLAVITHNSHKKNVEVVRITYECRLIKPDEKVVLSHEHDAYRWIDSDKLPIKQESDILLNIVKELRSVSVDNVGVNPQIL